MINLLHKQNGEIYDRFLCGELTLKDARKEFAALSRTLIKCNVKPAVIGVLEQIGKAWKEIAEKELIAAERTRRENVSKKFEDIDKTSPESLFLYK